MTIWLQTGLFVLGAALIGWVGPKLSRKADELGKITGLGQTLAGIIFLGASTSLPGLVVSFETAIQGRATLAVSNSVGGIAAQTLFIAIADIALRKGTLSHQDKLDASLLQSGILISLLSLISLAMLAPKFQLWHIHPISPVIILFVVIGFRYIQQAKKDPRWLPREVHEKGIGSLYPEEESNRDFAGNRYTVYGKYMIYLIMVGAGGWCISYAGSNILSTSSLSPIIMGATLMAIATSLPELVTSVAAVRRGRVSLAIGDIVGGNAFDTSMVALSDIAYREGPIFTAVSTNVIFLVILAILMTSILLIGFIRREKKGLRNIGVESYLIILVYMLGISAIIFAGGSFKD